MSDTSSSRGGHPRARAGVLVGAVAVAGIAIGWSAREVLLIPPEPRTRAQLGLPSEPLPFPPEPSAIAKAAESLGEGPAAFLALLIGGDSEPALREIESSWHPGSLAMTLDVMRIANRRAHLVAGELRRIAREKADAPLGNSLDGWWHHLWRTQPEPHPDYGEFKSLAYSLIDARFGAYFSNERAATALIRLDEVRWGGVRQDGIPPLRSPKMIAAHEADYLADDHVVFGIEVNGEARAYPKRILAWHEMFVDEVGGVDLAGVYCTLCGTVILYETTVGGVNHELGTSGFLYRSNKLMYDRATQSLWSTMRGTPVIGPLVDQDGDDPIVLPRRAVVTTAWGEWRRRHPSTTVLSLDTGHGRDYSEGAAYRRYFATDELMFTVPERKLDTRLKNKQEILGLTFPQAGDATLAIAADFLAANPVYHDALGPVELVVFTDPSGANRVYRTPPDIRFERYDGDAVAVDTAGVRWTIAEDAATAGDGRTLDRLPAQRAFWFGWNAAFETVRLVN